MKNNFSANLVSDRKCKSLTQKQLAELLSVDQRTISAWEKGICEPSIAALLQLCEVFEESLDDLILK